MKICVAQTRPFKGDMDRNVEVHRRLIDTAVSKGTDIIVFPELSLTGYEPELSEKLAINQNDKRLDVFQTISDDNYIIICEGMPTISNAGIQISMVIFQPNNVRLIYSKQRIHSDELPYFVEGHHQVILTIDNKKIAPGICYETLLPEHSWKAFKSEAEIYLASVAKPIDKVEKAFKHYPEIAKKYSMIVTMSNCIGPCNGFESKGRSAIWNQNGTLMRHLTETIEGLLIYDTDTEEIIEWTSR